VTLLSQLPDAAEDPPAAPATPSPGAFASALNQVLSRRP
jgi:L-fucose isomerase-like protein